MVLGFTLLSCTPPFSPSQGYYALPPHILRLASVAEGDRKLLIFLFYLPSARTQACAVLGLCGAGDRTWGFAHARKALCQPSHNPHYPPPSIGQCWWPAPGNQELLLDRGMACSPPVSDTVIIPEIPIFRRPRERIVNL